MRLWLVAALVLAPALAAADPAPVVTREARTEIAVTVYQQDLALVRDTREIPLPDGESAVRFEDVAARIDPRTVVVRSISQPDALEVVEQRYAFDLASPEKLLEKWVGREVELVETGERLRLKTTKATLLSVQGGPVYRVGERIAVGHPGRIVLPAPADGLHLRPTLLWRVSNGGPARHRVAVSYLTGGLSWAADYVAVLNEEETRTGLSGWVTVTNESGAAYDDATLKLVAGQVHRVRQPEARPLEVMGMAASRAGAPRFAEEALSEYHLYTLDRRATLAEGAPTQMRLFAADGVPLAKRFVVVGQPAWYRSRLGDLARDVPVAVYFEIDNTAANHLGMPLPAGTVRLYRRDRAGAEQLIGEDAIRHTAKGERMVLRAGDAFDVVASRVQTDQRAIDLAPYDAEAAFSVTVRNRRREPVTVSLREPVGGEWQVVESSHPPVRIDAGTLGFEAPVPAGGEAVVSYRVRVAR
jgi:hypothetical protein